ncbi:hypothetical protein BH20GEM1_BH20GEM1_22240 [soil metagenome]
MIPGPLRHRSAERIERMDAGEGTAEEIAEAHRLLDVVNRRLGGHRLTKMSLLPLVREGEGRIEIVDIAGGDGAFARRLREWAKAAGRDPRITVVDLEPVALAGVRSEAVAPVRANAFALPFADRTVDVAHCSCFFHHLSTGGARDALAELCRISRRAVIVNDLVRSRAAVASIWALTRCLVDNRLVRADGPLSVLKAFVPGELVSIAHAVGLSAQPGFRWSLRRGFPYRMALVGVRVGSSRR